MTSIGATRSVSPYIASIFTTADTNQDGKLDSSEFQTFQDAARPAIAVGAGGADTFDPYKAMDRDKDGFVTLDEVGVTPAAFAAPVDPNSDVGKLLAGAGAPTAYQVPAGSTDDWAAKYAQIKRYSADDALVPINSLADLQAVKQPTAAAAVPGAATGTEARSSPASATATSNLLARQTYEEIAQLSSILQKSSAERGTLD